MSASILENDLHGEGLAQDRAKEEACRRKIVSVREGLRDIFVSHGVALNQGVSNDDLISCVAQLCCQLPIRHVEHFETSWQEEYESFAQRIGSLVGEDNFTVETESSEIIQKVQSRYSPDSKEV